MPVGDRNVSGVQAVTLGTAIRELRESLGWSQSRLATVLCKVANHATVTRENISRWETGKRVPGAWWLRHLATVIEAGRDARQSFADSVDSARKRLLEELHRLAGGQHPALAARLGPMLERFGHELDARAAEQASELLAKAAKQFDPDDPTSPMSKHSRELHQRQEVLAATLERYHRDLTTKVEELTTVVKVTTSAQGAAATTAEITPFKGESYATGIHEVMEQIAVGLGDEYADTSAVPGADHAA